MSAGSIAILVRSDSREMAKLAILTPGFRYLPYIRSRNQSHLDSKMEPHQGFVCLDEIFNFRGSRGHHLLCVLPNFYCGSLLPFHKYIPQGSQFLENHMLHVRLCIQKQRGGRSFLVQDQERLHWSEKMKEKSQFNQVVCLSPVVNLQYR